MPPKTLIIFINFYLLFYKKTKDFMKKSLFNLKKLQFAATILAKRYKF